MKSQHLFRSYSNRWMLFQGRQNLSCIFVVSYKKLGVEFEMKFKLRSYFWICDVFELSTFRKWKRCILIFLFRNFWPLVESLIVFHLSIQRAGFLRSVIRFWIFFQIPWWLSFPIFSVKIILVNSVFCNFTASASWLLSGGQRIIFNIFLETFYSKTTFQGFLPLCLEERINFCCIFQI